MNEDDESIRHVQQAPANMVNSSASSQIVDPVSENIDREVEEAEEADAHTSKIGSIWSQVYELVWPDLILKHLDKTSLKTILRSWLMMWSLTLLCICGGTEEFMGPSSFLANFTAGIEIAGNLSVSSAFVYCMGDLLSTSFACLVSVVTLAICWRVRGYPTEASVIEDLLAHGHCANIPNPGFSNCIQPAMHKGYFLNTRITAITVFGMLFSFTICGYFQSVSKYGKLAWLLNSLYTIIVFPFNNLMPLWKPWHFARNCYVPMTMAYAAHFFVSLVVLPFSSNYKIVSSLATACSKLQASCAKIQSLSQTTRPSAPDFSSNFEFISGETQSIFTKLIINEVDMEMVNNLEVWFSHFENSDLTELRSQIRLIMSALSSFHFFYESMADRYYYLAYSSHAEKADLPFVRKYRSTSDEVYKHRHTPKPFVKYLKGSWKETGNYELRQKLKYHRLLQESNKATTSPRNNVIDDSIDHDTSTTSSSISTAKESKDKLVQDLDLEFENIIESYAPVVNSTCELLSAVSQWLYVSCDILPWLFWYGRSKYQHDLHTKFENVRSALDKQSNEISVIRTKVIPTDQQFALYGNVCLHFSRRVRRLARWCIWIHNERPTPKLSTPFNGESINNSVAIDTDEIDYDGFHDNIGSALERTYTSFKPPSKVQARNPDSTPPRAFLHLIGMLIEKVHRCLYDRNFLFCVKRAVLTTSTLTPYFCRTTSQLAFKHWFLWVAVLTAYTVAQQAVDGVYGLLAKFVFTFFGCLVGMVGWYISAGSGSGNPYGYATVTAFIWLYISFQRQFNKHFIPAASIVYSCTVTLVLGNSWNSGHVVLSGVELGRGFSVAWVRFVTVTIGITISFLGTIFPHAYTAKKAVRVIIGTCLEHLGDLQASISNFGVQRYNSHTTHIVANTDLVTSSARAIITNLNSAETLRKRLVYEPPLSGIYPTYRYRLLINYVHEVTLLYSLIYSFLDEIEDPTRIPQIMQIMGWTDPELSTGVYSLVYMACRALTDGKALPSVTAGNLTEQHIFGPLARFSLKPDGSHNKVGDETDATTITAVALSSQIYERLDGVIILIKELVGEVYDLNMDLFELDLEKQPFINMSRGG